MNIAKHLFKVPFRMTISPQNSIRFLSSGREYKFIKVEQKGTDDRVELITLNRPEALNALCIGLVDEVAEALNSFDKDPDVAATVLTGNEKSFAGGGLELALICDVIYGGEKARFGLPEIKIGIMPGAGGTQRLPRFIGKSRAMEMALTGDFIDAAAEALRLGLISKVFPVAEVVEQAIELADKIGDLSPPAVESCKASVKNAYETTLKDGLKGENELFKKIFKS